MTFTSDASMSASTDVSTSASTIILIYPWKRTRSRRKHQRKHNHKDQFFSFALMFACVCAATSENEIPLRYNTSTRTFTIRSYVWLMKTLDPDYLAPRQFGRFGWLRLCMLVFASHIVFTWVIPIAGFFACACVCFSSEYQALLLTEEISNTTNE